MIDYHEALREMHKGNVVKYVGTVNGNVMTDHGWSWCMCRGCIFPYNGEPVWKLTGRMVYDPDFRYVLTGETVDPRAWRPDENRIPKATKEDMERLEREAKKPKSRQYPEIDPLDRKEIKSKLGYSRIGLGNV